MELRHLRYFVKVAEELSFRSAAEQLHVSHPALSKQIKDLEYELETKLLGRNTANVWLTDAGKCFLTDAKDILDRVNQAVANVKSKSSDDNILSVANAGPFATLMHQVLRAFRQSHPEIDIHMVDMPPWSQITGLQRGEFHIGFISERHIVPSPALIYKHILDSEMGVVLSLDHTLANRQEVHCADIQKEKIYFMGTSRYSNHLRDIRRMMPKGKVLSQRAKRVESIGSLIAMIASGQGISLLPKTFVDNREKSVKFIPLADARDNVHFQLWAVWRKDDKSKALRQFVEMIDKVKL